MRKLIKSLISFCVFLLILFIPTKANAYSDIFKPSYSIQNAETGYSASVYDGASLFSEDEIQIILEKMYPITEYGDAGLYTTDENTVTGGENFYNDVQYNWFGNDSSTVMFIDMEDRYLWLHNYGYIEEMIDKKMAESIMDNVYSKASKEDYCGCVITAFEQTYKVADGQRIARPMKVICNILLSLLISLTVLFLIIKNSTKLARTDEKEWKKYLNMRVSFDNPNTELVNTTSVHIRTGGGSYGGGSHGGGGGHRSGGSHGGGGRSGGHRGSGGGHHF